MQFLLVFDVFRGLMNPSYNFVLHHTDAFLSEINLKFKGSANHTHTGHTAHMVC